MAALEHTFSANGSSPIVPVGTQYILGSINTVYAATDGAPGEDFGGGTLTVEFSPDEINWFPDVDNVFTEQGLKNFIVRARAIRLTLSGSTNPDLKCWVL